MIKLVNLWRLAIVLPLVVLAVPSNSDPSIPSWRGDLGTTHQVWGFENSDNPAAPSSSSNMYGSPIAAIVVGDFGIGWQTDMPGAGSQTGLWDLGGAGGSITIDLPNLPANSGVTNLWISLVCFEDFSAAPTVDVLSGGVATLLSEDIFLVEQDPISGVWNRYLWKWQIVPNSATEQVIFSSDMFGGSLIDLIEIDTQVVPEPGSMIVLGSGLAGVLGFGLRRKR